MSISSIDIMLGDEVMLRGVQGCSGKSVSSVEFLSWDVVDAVCEVIHAKLKAMNTLWQSVQLLVGQEGHKELVVCRFQLSGPSVI